MYFSQPFDVAVFSPLKAAYSNILYKRWQAGERGVWKGNFCTLLVEAQRLPSLENIRSGFWNTGLDRLDFEIIRRALNIRAPTSIGPSISADGTALASNQFPASPPRSLTAMSPAEVHAITTPRNPLAFHHLSQSLTMDLQHSNSPRTWRISHAVGKLPNTGIAAIYERDYVQERLQVAAERRREIANRNPGADDGSRTITMPWFGTSGHLTAKRRPSEKTTPTHSIPSTI